ncbi:MAG: hypothetical protein QF578_10170 [Alphaproteobacteria bacterium]|jgi:hypothetical protein|nr:hypothetical protein [Alphaproteobacteria bacterium]MDP6812297.1 hypothetical protein [Alphaproteobacteria bacterium]|tara:strand:- start:220 stop:504 length:285 start_codon:yes stop_codon:yes gene_type:complete
MSITYLEPVQEADVRPAGMAPRLASLEGITLGLLSNGKANAARLLAMIAEELGQQFAIKAVVEDSKMAAGSNADAALLDDLATRTDAVITGNGD